MIKIAIIILFTVSVCAGQLYEGLGVKAGLSSSNQDWNYTENYADIEGSNFKGFYFGVFVEGLNYNFFSSILEFSYVQKGFTTNFTRTVVAPDQQGYVDLGYPTNKFDYISLAYFVKLKYENNRPNLKFVIPARRSAHYAITKNIYQKHRAFIRCSNGRTCDNIMFTKKEKPIVHHDRSATLRCIEHCRKICSRNS